MPWRAYHPCHRLGCPELVKGRDRFCPAHMQQEQQQYDQQRGSSASRGYDARWRRLRRMVLASQPLCADPDGRHPGWVRMATDVDHIKPKAQGGDDSFENLQALCHECHSYKTAVEDGRWQTDRVGL